MKGEDRLLVVEIENGNQSVFEKLYHEYYTILVEFANKFLLNQGASEDVVQGVFVYFWENAKKIKLEKSIRSYLYQSVKNSCLNQLRAIHIRDKHQILYIEAILASNDDSILEDSELVIEIKKALAQLPLQMSDIFKRKYLSDMRIKDIASELSLSENTVKVQLFKARNRIRELLSETTGCYFLF